MAITYSCYTRNYVCVSVLTILNEGADLTVESIFHKALRDGIIAYYRYLRKSNKEPVFHF